MVRYLYFCFPQQLAIFVVTLPREERSALNIPCMSGLPRVDGGASPDTGRETLPLP